MSLQLNFSTCVTNGCTNIKFTETTGTYTTSNLGGWGVPNIILADANTAILTIIDPSSNEYEVDLFTDYSFPSSNSDYYIYITAESLGLSSIEDGKWTFTYTITTDTESYSKTKYSLFYCNSECCVKQLLTDLDLEDCGCGCKDLDRSDYIKAWSHLEALKNAAQCGSVTLFTKLKKIVDKLCKNKDCKTCK